MNLSYGISLVVMQKLQEGLTAESREPTQIVSLLEQHNDNSLEENDTNNRIILRKAFSHRM